MTILVIDDDPYKVAQIISFLRTELPQAEVLEQRSYQRGLRAVLESPPDIVLLDMTMPTYNVGGKEKGGPERRYAGQQILHQLKRKGITVPVIIVTQFERFGEGDDLVSLDEIRIDLRCHYPTIYVDAVYYQAADSAWMGHLLTLLTPYYQAATQSQEPHADCSDRG